MTKETFKHIKRGIGYLPKYGYHPGTGTLIFFILAGGIAGSSRGVSGALIGALLMFLFFGPFYLYGAYERSKDHG